MPSRRTSFNRRTLLQSAASGAIASAITATCRSEVADPSSAAPQGEIWDAHVHLASFAGSTPEAKTDSLLEFADRMGISRMITFMGWPWSYRPTPQQMEQENNQVLQALRHAPDRLLGFVYLNPADTQESLDQFRRHVVDGPMVGVKLWVAERCHGPMLDPIIELATQWQAVVYQHTWLKSTGNLEGESTPADLVQLAQRHPQCRLICGHAGGHWEWGMRIVKQSPSLMFEIAGSDPTAGITERAVQEFGAERIIYGSDAGGRSLATQLGKILGAEISDAEKSLILGGNIRRMLEPIMQRKGMLPT